MRATTAGTAFDVSYSKTDRNELILETYAGTGRAAGATDTIGFTTGETGTTFTTLIDYSDPNQIFVTDPHGWGGDRAERRDAAGLLQQPHRRRPDLAVSPRAVEGTRTGFLSRATSAPTRPTTRSR